MAQETPSNYIPGLYILGSTYDVLNGKYADSRSTLQQVIDWDKTKARVQEFGKKDYSVPKVVNFSRNTTTEYQASYGKTTSEYSKSLSAHAGLEADFPGFSASASGDYTKSEQENLANAFTRVTYEVTHYNLSLPPTGEIKPLLKTSFVEDLGKMDPIKLYKTYGTHLLRSMVVGGRAMFLYSTDTRSYSSKISIEVAAQIATRYGIASGKANLSTKEEEARKSFNESSEFRIETEGGDPQYGNEKFFDNVGAWTASTINYPHFIDFGSNGFEGCLTGLWELAATAERSAVLEEAYNKFRADYARNLTLSGPFIRARFTEAINHKEVVAVSNPAKSLSFKFPRDRADEWYYITPGVNNTRPIIVSELESVRGVLAKVEWKNVYNINNRLFSLAPNLQQTGDGNSAQFYPFGYQVWKPIPPTSDYVAMGCVITEGFSRASPPEELVGRFRAVHKNALINPKKGITDKCMFDTSDVLYEVDGHYWLADVEVPLADDCWSLNPDLKKTKLEGDGW